MHREPKSQKSYLWWCHSPILALPTRLGIAVRNAAHGVREYLRRLAKDVSECRECGRPANFFSTICKHCGAGNPIKINISLSVLVTGIVCELTLVFLQLI